MMNYKNVQSLEFPQRGDERGQLVISDGDVVHGQHANKKTQFVLINVMGTSKVKVKDGKENEAVFTLNRPHTGIYLPRMVWKDISMGSSML